MIEWELKVQQQVAKTYLAEFPEQIEWYKFTDEQLKPLISTRNTVKVGVKDNGSSTLFHPTIVVFIGEKPERHWNKINPVCIPFGHFERSRSAYDFGSIELGQSVPKVTGDYYYSESGKLKTLIKKLAKEKRDLEVLIENAGNQFYSALLTINTDKKLNELLPDAVKYIPTKKPKSLCTDILPVELYASVNALISGK